ncbi:MAG TPA: pitrilysin family protein [Candidatus Baltobacteraceae bacterium]|nr:pitrilysin family protein [Candidatus Baltobacteraceae bacterium]
MIRASRLPNGMLVVSERMAHVRSATIGVWCDVGSASEPPERRGISHLLEHMVFKGTERRTARAIAEEMDAVGGELNAMTDKETTCFYAHVVDRQLARAVDVLADLVQHARFDEADLRREQQVVLEEIRMYDDSPSEVVHDAFARALWRGANLGDPTIGFSHTVTSIERDDLVRWREARYGPRTTVVTAAGNLDHDALVTLVGEAFAEYRGAARGPEPERPRFTPAVDVTVDETEQAYVLLGVAGLSMRDERRYALSVLDAILGGGMSSRLFQSVREERALAYEIGTFQLGYRETGLFGVSAGCAPERLQECVDVVSDELDRLVHDGARRDEVERAKEHLKGSLTLALESTFNRMARLARNELVHGRDVPTEEVEAAFDAVDVAVIDALARELLAGPRGLCVLGPAPVREVRLRGAEAA